MPFLADGTLAVVESGDRMLIWCEGGPSIGRAVLYPPPLELEADDGMYVLVDDGPPEQWQYVFVPADRTQ